MESELQKTIRRLNLSLKRDNNPLPPVEQLEKLHSFRPDLVDKVIEFCAEETKHRRQLEKDQFEFFKSETRINRWIVSIIIFFVSGYNTRFRDIRNGIICFGSMFYPYSPSNNKNI